MRAALFPATVTLVAVLSIVAVPAAAGDGPVVIRDNHGGIATTVTDPGLPGHAVPASSTKQVATRSPVTCSYVPDASNHSGGTPEWELTSPHVGEQGAWYFRQCSDGSLNPVWIPARAPRAAGVPTVTPGQLAVQAVNYLPLPTPMVHHNPDSADGRPQTVVGVRTWLWVDPSSFRPLRQSTSAGVVSATVTATPVSTYWQTGSTGAPDVRCAGAGTPYDPARAPAAQTTDCATTYTRPSAGQPQSGPDPNDRFFIATVTTTWRVSWTGTGGATGTLPDIERSTRFAIAVAELQAVNR